jgi:predicted secreted protein
MILGEDLILALNGTPLAASKSCNLDKSQSFIDVSDPTDGRWEACVPQKLSWSISSDCLIATLDAYKTLNAAWKAGTALTVRFFDTEYNENETGTAYIDKLSLGATKGNLAKLSVSLRGSGPLSDYGGSNIPFTKELLQSGKYYHEIATNSYVAYTGEDGKIYGGSITLSKRTKVRVTAYGCDMFFSQSNGIIAKASDAQSILATDYSIHINNDSNMWLDAGTWYIVVSNEEYQSDPNLKDMAL